MNDKELINLAAKAAGVTIKQDACSPWNPLEDDGTALQLAVKLKLVVGVAESVSWCETPFIEVQHDDAVGFDPGKATRLAIVRAAAEIGKA